MWDVKMQELTKKMTLAREIMKFDQDEAPHRRGQYASINMGISYGGGATVSQ